MVLPVGNQFLATDVRHFQASLQNLQSRVHSDQIPSRDAIYEELSQAIDSAVQACREFDVQYSDKPEYLREMRLQFQEAIAPWFDSGWIARRSRQKPRGYPGDFELLTVFYDRGPIEPGFSGYVDLYVMNLLLADAIRARWQQMREFLIDELGQREGQVSVLNVASGACREYAQPMNLPPHCHPKITCIDSDPGALDFVREHVLPGSDITQFELVRYNALRLKSAAATRRRLGTFDIIYSIGLVDYIPDNPLVDLLSGLRESCKPGGVVYINFKDANRYDMTAYDWLLDWRFVRRTEADCRRLFAAAGFDVQRMEVTRDSTGVIMNFVHRVAQRHVRFDPADTPAMSDAPISSPESSRVDS